jgi:hypothetical protein
MKCQTKEYGELPTLHIDTGQGGGFAELRPYTEATVFVVVSDESDAKAGRQKDRVVKILNHLLALYQLVTQDPWVIPIDPQLDLYLIDDALGAVPADLVQAQADQLLLPPVPIIRETPSRPRLV